MSAVLYVVATPLGNLSDLSPRAVDVLKSVDLIAAEDTRVTLKLLYKFEIKNTLVSYNKNNERSRGAEILAKLRAGCSVALVTDAGTPAISDPGEGLVALALAEKIAVVPVPGCCAAVAALSVCGLPAGRFCFEGFLPMQKSGRRARLAELKEETRVMVFYEAPHKLRATLCDLIAAFGDRRVSIQRELTKLHEEIRLTTLQEAARYFEETAPRGEFVLIVEGAPKAESPSAPIAIDKTLSAKDNAHAARAAGLSRNEAYRLAIQQTERKKQKP